MVMDLHLDVSPPLQNKLWDMLVRGQFHPVALAGDSKKAFPRVPIKVEHCDGFRFHWLRSTDSKETETLRFTKALFGLGGVIQQHLLGWCKKRPECVEDISRSMYVDNLMPGASDVPKAQVG